MRVSDRICECARMQAIFLTSNCTRSGSEKYGRLAGGRREVGGRLLTCRARAALMGAVLEHARGEIPSKRAKIAYDAAYEG